MVGHRRVNESLLGIDSPLLTPRGQRARILHGFHRGHRVVAQTRDLPDRPTQWECQARLQTRSAYGPRSRTGAQEKPRMGYGGRRRVYLVPSVRERACLTSRRNRARTQRARSAVGDIVPPGGTPRKESRPGRDRRERKGACCAR